MALSPEEVIAGAVRIIAQNKMIRALIFLLLVMVLVACVPVAAISTGVAVLSDTATLACAVQSFANTENLPNLSHDAGILCSW